VTGFCLSFLDLSLDICHFGAEFCFLFRRVACRERVDVCLCVPVVGSSPSKSSFYSAVFLVVVLGFKGIFFPDSSFLGCLALRLYGA